MERMSVSYFQTALENLQVTEAADGGSIIHGMPIFRTGRFKDSMGDQHHWERIHLDQMVHHFTSLRDNSILPNVPVRIGHRSLFGGGGEVIGYIQDLRVDGQDNKGNDLLVADLEITEPDAYGKLERGTLRARSAEIGMYETNDETTYWPVVMGVAFVDLPAVEGLFSNKAQVDNKFTPVRDEENPVGKNKNHSSQDPTNEPPEGTAPGQAEETDPPPGAPASEGGDGGEGGEGEETPPAGEGGEGGEETPPTSEHNHPGSNGGPLTFRVNGQSTADYAAVQAHIENLENFRDETRENEREQFMHDLAERNVVPATQVDALVEFAQSLSPEQWEQYRASYEAAPSLPQFAHHGAGGDNPDGDGPDDPREQELDDLEEMVAMHRRAGMSEEKVRQTESYQRLQELKAAGNGTTQ